MQENNATWIGNPRFDSKIEARLLVPSLGDCWIWTAALTAGYGMFGMGGRKGGVRRAHIVAYETLVGPRPEGLQLDHVCHTVDKKCLGGDTCPHRACVNPAHLELVTPAENSRRSRNFGRRAERCPQGHEYSIENTYLNPHGSRLCRECARINGRRVKDAARANAGKLRFCRKLTDAQMNTIRTSATGKRGEQTRMAKEYGITISYVGLIIRGYMPTGVRPQPLELNH